MQDRRLSRRATSRWIAATILTFVVTSTLGCGHINTSGRASSYLQIDLLEAASGATPTIFTTLLQSDVVTKGGVFEDVGQVSLRMALKDPGLAGVPNSPSSVNLITVTRYHVTYRRSDGRNTAGVDVPYAFDGAVTGTIDVIGGKLIFVLVRGQAKLEAPLAALRGGGGAAVISTIADVTFYGQDQNGNQVSVSGSISVNFADWADPV
ncbi:MAG: hypothetical protein WCP29_03665 [Acidobacteriota bacterium]